MNATKIALLAIAALAFAGCGPKNLPNTWSATPQTGSTAAPTQNQFEDVPGDEDTLTEAGGDARAESAEGDRVSSWIDSNSIPEKAKLAVIYFGFDRYNVEAGERAKLEAALDAVKRGGGNVYIVGYSDYYGTEEYNLALSDKRAQAVKNYLKQLGADDSAQIRALGEAFAVQNGTRQEVAEDRKVIVVDGATAE